MNFRVFAAIAACLILSACSKGLERSPNFSNQQTYRETIDKDFTNAKQEEIEAFNFAVSDRSFDQLKQNHPKASYRKIAKDELDTYVTSLQTELKQAEQQKAEFEKRITELASIKVEVLGNELTHDSFFDKRDLKYSFRLTNGSTIPMSKVQLDANLSINGKSDVLYNWRPVVTFENGLRPGQTATFTGSMVGFLSFAQPITLEVREAKSREVRLEVKDLADFSEKWFIGSNSPLDKLKLLPARIEEAKKHLAVLGSN